MQCAAHPSKLRTLRPREPLQMVRRGRRGRLPPTDFVIARGFVLWYHRDVMHNRKRLKKTGMPRPPRGVRLPRNRKFEPKLETKSGAKVRSRYEKRCADYLHSKNIRFVYEPLILLDERQYRPDFYLPDHNIFIEICGYGHMPHYNDRTAHKMRIYHKRDLQAIFIYYNGSGSLEDMIAKELEEYGVPVA